MIKTPENYTKSWGYPSKEACQVCGNRKNNQAEPRFGYVVCEDHQNVPAIDVVNKD